MARLYESADVPEFSNYPASVGPGLEQPEPLRGEVGSPELNDQARKIGGALGRAVSSVRDTAERAGERLRDAADEVQEKVQEIRNKATTASFEQTRDELREQAKAKARELQWEARTRFYQLRGRARVYVQENPFRVILGAAALGVLLGAVLRFTTGRRS